MKLAFTTEYDGSIFSGFQRQKNADSVQQNIEEALEKITQEKVVINYAGRTDAGVHALSQVFDFTTELERPNKNWIDGINSNLADSVAVTSISRVPDDFHSRYSAIERSYTYVIYNSRSKPLFFGNMSHWDNNKIDQNLLKLQANMFLGTHDFTSFRSSSCNSKNPTKTINMIDVETHDKFIFITIKANAFLHNMVRIMVGTLLDIAKGEINSSVEEILSKKDRSFAGKTLSAKGLFFLGPKYDLKFNIASPIEHLMDRFKKMNSPKVKICGISNIEILKDLINLNIDFIGFIFYEKSPRFANNTFLESIKDIDFKDSRPVCVYVNPDEDYVYQTSSYFNNPILQFHGDEENNFCESFGLDYWKAIRVKNNDDLKSCSLFSSAQAILLENHKEGSYGGTGESFNWQILKDIDNDDQNIVLSGGINSQNVDNALKTNSWCLDLNSGVESQEGIKNIELVTNILKTIKAYGI